jgi:hypothetical protein
VNYAEFKQEKQKDQTDDAAGQLLQFEQMSKPFSQKENEINEQNLAQDNQYSHILHLSRRIRKGSH